MKHVARRAALLAGLASFFTLAPAGAQTFPSKTITVVVPFVTGGLADRLGRLVAEALKDDLGVATVVENKAGAGGNLGARAVATAAPDGHTLILGTTGTHALNGLLYRSPGYDPLRDFAPVAGIATAPLVLLVGASQPYQNVKELVAYAKANPGKLSYGSAGAGTTSHLSAALLTSEAGVNITHTPYKGVAPAIADVVGGHVTMAFDNLGTVMQLVDAGKLRAVAVTSAQRSPLRPELPTFREAGFRDYEVNGYYGLFAPAGTPAPIIERLNRAVNKYLSKPETRESFAKSGIVPMVDTPAYLGGFMSREKTRWETIIRGAGLSAE